MIFSNFFKAKWQHKDANVRITAINDELDSHGDKAVLTELANTDTSNLVRRAALLKLASFDTWLNASKSNDDNKIQAFAQKQIEQIVFEQHDIRLNAVEKLELISNATLSGLISYEAWLIHEQSVELVLALYHALAKPHLLLSTFTQKQNDEIQQALLVDVADVTLLEKLLKKANSPAISAQIEHTISEQKLIAEKPSKVRKQLQLLLSKLLALKDVSEYQVVIQKRAALVNEWQALLEELTCLPADEQVSTAEKYQSINEQLDKLFVEKAEQYQQQLIAQKLEHDKQQDRNDVNQTLTQLNQSLTTAIYQSETVDEGYYQLQLSNLSTRINESVLGQAEKNTLLDRVKKQANTLSQLPVIAQSISDATHLISKISQLSLPSNLVELNERQPIFNDWLAQYKVVEQQSFGILPESIRSSYNEIKQQWKKALAPLNQQQKSLLLQTQKKISEFNRLVSNGKFNACFGVFKRIQHLHEQLNDAQKLRVQRDYSQCEDKITELGDWENYIATPRKEELLVEIQALVTTPLDNPNEQAEKVKACRKKWNLLGHAEADVEQTLNKAFNDACEQAFAPCRLFYNEQDKLREQHLVTRLQVIEHAKITAELINQDEIDYKSVEGQLNKLLQRWREAGEVERSKYRSLNTQFNAIVTPVKKSVNDFHQSNSAAKQALITKAQQALSEQDIETAVNTAKSLQRDWKTIGFCGSRDENKLWSLFREANDAIFAELSETRAADKNAQAEKVNAFADELSQLTATAIDKANDIATLNSNVATATALLTRVYDEKVLDKRLIQNIEQCISQNKRAIEQAAQNKEKEGWLALFALLEHIALNELTLADIEGNEHYLASSPQWQKRIKELLNNNKTADRAEKTLALEIFAGVDSPEQLKGERMQVQLSLMQQQMLSGNSVDLEQGLQEWLLAGKLSDIDTAYLARIKPIYCK